MDDYPDYLDDDYFEEESVGQALAALAAALGCFALLYVLIVLL